MSDPELGVQTTVTPEGTQVVHLNYAYDAAADAVAIQKGVSIAVSRPVHGVKVHTLSGSVQTEVDEKNGVTEICLRDVPVYAAVELL